MISFSKQSAKYLLFLCVIATLLTTLSSRPYRTSTAIYHNVGSQRIQHSPSSSGMMRLHATTSSGSVGTANDAVIDIRTVTNSELELAAEFLTYYMYPSSIPTGQRKELQRLEKQDLDQRYSERLGKKKFPSAMFCVVPNGSSRLKSAKDLIG